MAEERFIKEIANCLSEEYQSLWIIDSKDLAMRLFWSNEDDSIPGSLEIVSAFNNYATARQWYVDNCVVEQDKARLFEMSSVDNINAKLSEGKPYYIEYNRISAGTINYNQLYFSGIYAEDGTMEHFVLGFRDIDIRKKAERDDLTGLYTRQIFFQKAEKLISDNPDTRFDLSISDIVDFKEVNESYGPKMGDEILKWSGNQLAALISDDVLVGRYGGDQFVIVAPHDKFLQLGEKQTFSYFDEMASKDNLPKITVKYGIYNDIKPTDSIISVCDKAHMALNSIKHQYGTYVAFYDEKIKSELDVSRKIENSMHKALKEEQFKVYYQPKHDSVTGKLVGAEALIRWIHPEYGFMSPGDFIPLFEKNGFVVETDNYVWDKTCKNLRRWKEAGINTVPISVNASKLTFEQEHLIETYNKSVKENGIDPKMLHIEITETLMTDDVDALVNKLTDIRSEGYKIELDDFGAGYSSINILSTLPMDIVKLDMSFMKQFGDIKRSKVLAACINLAKELGYRTVSEGVELKEQCETLRTLGVDTIQGYYYSRPLPEAEFEQYMKENA